MTRILALGTGPMLDSAEERTFNAHSLRTWHLVKPLLEAGHEVLLYTLPSFTERPETQAAPGVECASYEGLPVHHFRNNQDEFNLRELSAAAVRFAPQALLGINSLPCYVLARVDSTAPMWADFNGSVVFEGQVKTRVYGNNAMLGTYWQMEATAMRRADRFSTVSQRQFYALHGELAAVGRMNRHTFDYPYATLIANAYNPFFADEASRALCKQHLRGAAIPQDAFVLLWSGSYNCWTNVEVLMAALERAMAACPGLHYLSTGGQVFGHDDLTYPRMLRMVARSPHRERFHLLGWVETSDLPGLYAQADLGLCLDGRNFETMFGARNRVINMMATGVPVAMTDGTEIGEELVRAGCALGYPPDDPEALARVIIDAYARRGEMRELGEQGRNYVMTQFTYEATTRDLVAWATAPTHAPDNLVKLARAERLGKRGLEVFSIATNPIEERLGPIVPPPPVPPPPARPSLKGRLKGAVLQAMGPELAAKARFIRRQWLKGYWPAYRRRQAELRAGRPGRLEDLYIFLTSVCNARCRHCFYIDELGTRPDELTLEDYRKLAPTLPPLRHLTLTGGEALLHPECREIAHLLAWATRAERLVLISNGFLGGRLEALCASLLEEGLPGVLDVLISLDGLEENHNATRGNPRAWANANHALGLLAQLKQRHPWHFDYGVTTIIHNKNYRELEPLNDHLRANYPGCRHGFELIRGSDFSVWGLPREVREQFNPAELALPPTEEWDNILATLKRINRRAGLPHVGFYLTTVFAMRMLREKRKLVDCVSAGQNVGVIYSQGGVAMCEFSKPFGNLRDYAMDFQRAWTSPEAETRRAQLRHCFCTHGCYLSKNIEYSRAGQMAMLKM